MVTLCHLSDVHLAPVPAPDLAGLRFKQALGIANWRYRRHRVHDRATLDRVVEHALASRPDHFVITGDLVNFSLPAEFTRAADWLGALADQVALSVIPGNHDAIVSRPWGEGFERWATWMGEEARAVLAERPAGPAPREREAHRQSAFPFTRRLGDVLLIGLSSAVPTPPFYAAGSLGQEQCGRLDRLLAEAGEAGLARVVLIHHPPLPGLAPRRCGLWDSDRLEAILATRGAELVLHGHNHRWMRNRVVGPAGPIPVLGAPSASARHGSPLGLAGYHLIEIAGSRGGGRGARITATAYGLVEHDGSLRSREVLDFG
ncbi:MAG: metallophosphoesterase [Rhizobiales bacterium]|nr:metallophosphoesterase [Hyphomicrobiales bacterium]